MVMPRHSDDPCPVRHTVSSSSASHCTSVSVHCVRSPACATLSPSHVPDRSHAKALAAGPMRRSVTKPPWYRPMSVASGFPSDPASSPNSMVYLTLLLNRPTCSLVSSRRVPFKSSSSRATESWPESRNGIVMPRHLLHPHPASASRDGPCTNTNGSHSVSSPASLLLWPVQRPTTRSMVLWSARCCGVGEGGGPVGWWPATGGAGGLRVRFFGASPATEPAPDAQR